MARGVKGVVHPEDAEAAIEAGAAAIIVSNHGARQLDTAIPAIEALPDKERIVVSFYYYEGLTMREMADAMHLTEGRISQLHSQAMSRLRNVLADTRPEITFDA